MSDVKIVGPIALGRGSRILKLVRGDQTLGRLIYWVETGTEGLHVKQSGNTAGMRRISGSSAARTGTAAN